jgi:hypothetical protein
VAASAAAILSGQSIATANNAVALGIPLLLYEIAAPFGRNVTVVADGAATSTVTVDGWDYLGQPMRETLTLNGTTTVNGVKAFKYFENVSWGATAGRTINVGFGGRFGVPFKTSNVVNEQAAGAAAAAGTLTAGSRTDPQTATTNDPRGLYTPTTTPNGTTDISFFIIVDDFINAAGNGGIYGIKHFRS